MKIKALVFDLDGTAVVSNSAARPSNRLIKAVEKAKKVLPVSIATGRTKYYCGLVLKDLQLDQPVVLSGGAEIFDPVKEEIIWRQFLSPSQIEEIHKLWKRHGVLAAFENDVETLAPEIYVPKGNETIFYYTQLEKNKASEMLPEIQKISKINFHLMNSWHAGKEEIHVTHELGTKKHALDKVLQKLGVEKKDIMVVGDGENDLPLFEGAGFRVAMGNASEKLKFQADYIAPSIDNDGLAEVIEKFILEENR